MKRKVPANSMNAIVFNLCGTTPHLHFPLQLVVGAAVLSWSLSHCNQLRSSFKTSIDSCAVSDYYVTCAIPANGMNAIVFDLCNTTLVCICLTAAFNLAWHLRSGKKSP